MVPTSGAVRPAGLPSTTNTAKKPPKASVTNVTPPTISGSPVVGSQLRATPGTWSSDRTYSLGYQWQRCTASGRKCTNLNGATGATYTAVSADGGAALRVLATASTTGGSASATSATAAVTAAATTDDRFLWRGDMETGNLDEWTAGGAGGLFNSGTWDAGASNDVAHSGQFSLRTVITAPSESGVRAFRWGESRANREAYYSAWFYFPAAYTLTGDPHTGQYWNIFQFKSRSADSTANDAIWQINLYNAPDGGLLPYVVWSGKLPGPHQGESGWRSYAPLVSQPIPVGRWVHFEAFLRQGNNYDGALTVWQDGTPIFGTSNVNTSYVNPNYNSWGTANEWSVNNYSDAVSPGPAVVYIDDAAISSAFIP